MIVSNVSGLFRLFLIITISFFAGTSAVIVGQVRTSATPNPKIKVIYPEIKFNAEQAKAALERGTSTIKGQVCSAANGQFYLAANTPITLFPMTPYFEEWYRLRDDKGGKNTWVRLSEESARYRIDSYTNNKGEFQFTEMKPGRYFIFADNQYTFHVSRTVQTGTIYGSRGPIGGVFEDRTYAIDKKKRIEKIVEIKKDGDTEKVNLRSGFGGLINIGSCKRRL